MILLAMFNEYTKYKAKSLPYASQRETSKQGAKTALGRSQTQFDKILAVLTEKGIHGATASELKPLTGIEESSTMAARLNGLMKAGKIIATDETRKGISGINQIIWRII